MSCLLTEESLSHWFTTEQGRYLLHREQIYFDRTVKDIFGFNALQLGLPQSPFLNASRIALHIKGGHENKNDVRLCYTHLPFDAASLDLVILPHVLEFSKHPHQVLREISRILMPEGHLIISGFNPHSLWGGYRLFANKQIMPWCGHFIALQRIKDWLALLGFDIVGGRFTAYAPPFEQEQWLMRCACLENAGDRWWAIGGSVYFVHAIKRVHGVNLITPQWHSNLVDKLLPISPVVTPKN